MKKILSVILCLVLIVSSCVLLVGCVDNNVELYKNDLVKEVIRENDTYTIKLIGNQYVDTLVLNENADKVDDFEVHGKNSDGSYTMIYKQDRIDKLRVCALDGMVTDELVIKILKKRGNTKINKIKAYNSELEKREKSFRVTEYMLTGEKYLSKNKDNPDFYGYFTNITDLILLGEINLDENCDIWYKEGEEDFTEDIAVVREIQNKVQNQDMKIVVSISVKKLAQTGSKKPNAEIAKSIKNNISKIVKSVADFAEKYNIEGVDFDWEYPENKSQWDAYSLLLIEISKELKKSNRFVTVALAPWCSKLTREAEKSVEYVNLMLYDLFDERGDHASFYETTHKDINEFLRKTEFTKEQIMVGLSFYGRTTNKSGAAWPDMSDLSIQTALGKWGNIIKDYEYKEKGEIKKCDAYINGYAMNRDKTMYAISSGMGGVMIFRMRCDAPATYEYSLHNAVNEALARGLK